MPTILSNCSSPDLFDGSVDWRLFEPRHDNDGAFRYELLRDRQTDSCRTARDYGDFSFE